jgi:DNA polymerase III epsilon subunit family exonuclease
MIELPASVVAFDLETTGLSAVKNRIVEIGAVKETPAGTQVFSRLINPGCPMPKDASDVNGITTEMLKDAPFIKDVLPEFLEFIGTNAMIAHNAPFDVGFLSAELQRARLALPSNIVLDTQTAAKMAHPGWAKYNLQHLRVMLDLPKREAHRAVGDAETCLDLWNSCIPNLGAGLDYTPFLSRPGFDGQGLALLSNEGLLDLIDMRRSWHNTIEKALGSMASQIELERLYKNEKMTHVATLFGIILEIDRWNAKKRELHLLYIRSDGKESSIPISKLSGMRLLEVAQGELFV